MARRNMPQEEIGALLEYAAQKDTAATALNYISKFREEYAAQRRAGTPAFNVTTAAFYHRTKNQILAGVGYDTVWTPRAPVPDSGNLTGSARATLVYQWAAASVGNENGKLQDLQVIVASRRIGIWAGRKESGVAAPEGGGVVLTHAHFDGGGAYLVRPLNVPLLGPLRIQTDLGRVENILDRDTVQRPIHPYFWTARLSFELFQLLRVGINRGLMFGGRGNYPITAKRLFNNFIGNTNADHEGAFANQVVSVDGRLRMPARTLPAVLYLDWGSEDAAGGWWRVPGIIGGAAVGPFQRADVTVGLERVEFVRNMASNSDWYQNPWFRGGWTNGGALLGHPLGGHGVEWRGYVAGGSPAQGVSGQVALFHRWRGQQNLFAPDRLGHSVGGALNIDARVSPAARAFLQSEVEHGSNTKPWSAYTLRAGLRYRLY